MSDSDAPSWPDDEDPFSSIDDNSLQENDGDVSNADENTLEDGVEENLENDDQFIPDEKLEDLQWRLPIRAAPIMALSGDEVQEFPLIESPDGLSSTSLVINENVIRIVEANYGKDGQRRLNIKSAIKHELTGFSHNHNELMHKHQWLWISAFAVGLLSSILIPTISILGQLLLGIGLVGWIYMHLEVHSLEFSANGSKHKITFTGYGSNRPRFRASMALIGPTLAKYMESGDFDTESINELHESLTKPQEIPQLGSQQIIAPNSQMQPLNPQPNQLPPPNPPEEMDSQLTPEVNSLPPPPAISSNSISSDDGDNNLPPPPPPQEIAQNDSVDSTMSGDHTPPPPAALGVPAPPSTIGPPTSAPPSTHAPPPPAPLNAPAPPTTTGPPIPPPPTKSSLPPATLPPPLPPPIGLGLGPIDAGEVPLNAPLPDAPEIAVKASPVEESLTEDEQNELLEELK